MLENVAPSGQQITEYDRRHLYVYAELIEADREGIVWETVALDILGRDPAIDPETVRLCWDTHLARARWITGAGLAAALEAFGKKHLPAYGS